MLSFLKNLVEQKFSNELAYGPYTWSIKIKYRFWNYLLLKTIVLIKYVTYHFQNAKVSRNRTKITKDMVKTKFTVKFQHTNKNLWILKNLSSSNFIHITSKFHTRIKHVKAFLKWYHSSWSDTPCGGNQWMKSGKLETSSIDNSAIQTPSNTILDFPKECLPRAMQKCTRNHQTC